MVHGSPFYIWKDRWWGCDEAGLHDYLMHWNGWVKVLYGRTIAHIEWDALYKRAKRTRNLLNAIC